MKTKKTVIELWKRGRLGQRQMELKEFDEIQEVKKRTYPQNWQAYNLAQQTEKIYLMDILVELVGYIPFPTNKKSVGRKPISWQDKVLYLAFQAYNTKSSRRCIADLEISRQLGYLDKTPHFNTILKILKEPGMTPILKHLVTVSGLPLQEVETDFATDATGFGTSIYSRWFDVRVGKDIDKRQYLKAHITCGTKTNIITAVNITPGTAADSPQFVDLITTTKRVFDIREVSADKAYSSKANLDFVSSIGGIGYIPFKENTSQKSRGSFVWRRMLRHYTYEKETFMEHYHKRSNSESTNHMLKIKFGGYLRSKTVVGQSNEILAKCLCHNICVLIQEALELKIPIDLKKCADFEIEHK